MTKQPDILPDRETLQRLTGEILDTARPASSLSPQLKALKGLLEKGSGFRIDYRDAKRGETRLSSGLALSPSQAALCVDELLRTVTFLRGLNQAIADCSDTAGGPVHVLYAGCGPFALLALPLMSIHAAHRLQFTLLDLHQESVAAAKALVEYFGHGSSVLEFASMDACRYEIRAHRHPQIILSETMNVCLKDEPQVSIFRHLFAQAPDAVLIPSGVTVSAWLLNAAAERPGNGGIETNPAQRQRTPLGLVFAMSREKLDEWRDINTAILPANTIKVPDTFQKCFEVTLLTIVTVYRDFVLGTYESSLTMPERVPVDTLICGGETLHFSYRLGERPTLVCDVTAGRELRFENPVLGKIAKFLLSIGLYVEQRPLPASTETPGIDVEYGSLLVDEARLRHPGDLLYMAGHMAVSKPPLRNALPRLSINQVDDMAVIAWSWAAAVHIGLAPELVFHEQGYKGWSSTIIENFSTGHFFGVPMLAYLGLTRNPDAARTEGTYPHMEKWLVV